jgi:potassium-transporting ATPase KdpC subunit
MRKDLTASAVAIVLCTLVLGLAYPLLTTGVAQVLFPGKADGSQVTRDGGVVGSRLIGQDFEGDPAYFQPRPSQTGFAGDASGFANLGPNQRDLRDLVGERIAAYLKRERPYAPGLTVARIPVDAVTNSASGVDPHISQANARIQADRVAAARHVPLERVLALVDAHTDGRFLGLLGEPGVNVLELNLALDQEAR